METEVSLDRCAGSLLQIRALVRSGVGRLRAFVKRFAAQRRMAQECAMLTRMSDRELRDIGIGRANLRAIADGLLSPHVLERARPRGDLRIATVPNYRATGIAALLAASFAGGFGGLRTSRR